MVALDRLPGGSAEPGKRALPEGEEGPSPTPVPLLTSGLPCRDSESASEGHVRLEAVKL